MQKRRLKRHPVVQPIGESYRLIPLTRNLNAIVDLGDFAYLSQWNWYAISAPNTSYAARKEKEKTLFMHNTLVAHYDAREVDHHNHNGLDNRRENLRVCSHADNMKNVKRRSDNKSGFKGVSWDKENNKWQVHIRSNGKNRRIGRFVSLMEAAKAYNEAARKYHGSFANLNILGTQQNPPAF